MLKVSTTRTHPAHMCKAIFFYMVLGLGHVQGLSLSSKGFAHLHICRLALLRGRERGKAL